MVDVKSPRLSDESEVKPLSTHGSSTASPFNALPYKNILSKNLFMIQPTESEMEVNI